MTDPPHKPQETPTPPPQHHHQQEQPKRLCDYCNDRTAILYCRADSAKLCFSCDREVHSTNQLFSKHSRSLLCDRCDASPASIFCETEHSVLCSNCDWENHGKSTLSFSPAHNRRSIESFTGRPSVNELFAVLGFDDFDKKALFWSDENSNDSNTNYFGDDGLLNLLVWEPPEFVSVDDLIVTSDSSHNYHAMGVPPLPKNRNAACGKYKEEMLLQLRQLAQLKSDWNYENVDVEPIIRFHSAAPEQNLQPGNMYTGSGHDAEPICYPAYKGSGLQLYSDPSMLSRNHFEETSVVPDDHPDIGGCVKLVSDGDEGGSQQPISTETLPVFPRVSLHELNSQERDSAISRYKEKKKTRRYDKHIRYESRKVRAESRTRIKGRFAKIDQ